MSNNKRCFKKSKRGSSNVNPVSEVHHFEVAPKFGYKGYQLYFDCSANEGIPDLLKRVRAFESFINRNISMFPLVKIAECGHFELDLKVLIKDAKFITEWSTFSSEIIDKTEVSLSCLGLGMHQTIVKQEEIESADKENFKHAKMVRCRLLNHEPVTQIKNLKVSSYGKLVLVKGTVINVGAPKLQCTHMAFSCSLCTGTQVVGQVVDKYAAPSKCASRGCRARSSNFLPLLSSPNTKTINSQNIILQEVIEDDSDVCGQRARTLEVCLTNDLVRKCTPGDYVSVTGIMKVHNTTEASARYPEPAIYLIYLDAVAMLNEKTRFDRSSAPGITFNTKDYYAIEKIHAEPDLFRLLVHSLCPKIYGHETVKAGMVLTLFGGTENTMNVRSDCHLLCVGDPGLGKSEILLACSAVAPRGVYVSGTSSTSPGLTVTMNRDGGDFSLEAGALILADRGCCCIDEFDKMSSQHACLLEVMEQQTISMAKAGLICSLPARASIIAGGNPSGGHYNKSETVAKNLKIHPALLSRFDLIFIMLDKPNEELDKRISEHVLHLGRHTRQSQTSSVSSTPTNINERLRERLKLQPGEKPDHLPHVLYRKYIAYAKKYVHPQLNAEAKKILSDFYIDLRKRYHNGDSTPVTTRQLESLVRLTEARAKVELREEATAEDANDVIDIMRASLVDVFSDDVDVAFERSRNRSGAGGLKNTVITKFLNVLRHKARASDRSTFTQAELKQLFVQLGGPEGNYRETIDSLNLQGYLLSKGKDSYQLVLKD